MSFQFLDENEMMLREVLLKEDLHHMMSIDDGNFPGDDIIPMSQIFTEEEEEETDLQEKKEKRKRKPGRVRLPGMRFPPDKKNASKNGGNTITKTRGALSPPRGALPPPGKKAVPSGRPSFNSLFKRRKAQQAKVKATEESIEKIIELVASGDDVEEVTDGSETVKKQTNEEDNPGFPDDESDSNDEKTSDRLKPTGDNRRDEYPPPPPYPTRLPSHSSTLPNLFDKDWLMQMEHAIDQTAAHLTPDPMSYLR